MYARRENSIKIPYIRFDPLAVALQSMGRLTIHFSAREKRLAVSGIKIHGPLLRNFTRRTAFPVPTSQRGGAYAVTDTRAYVHCKHPVCNARKTRDGSRFPDCLTKASISHTASRKRHFEPPPSRNPVSLAMEGEKGKSKTHPWQMERWKDKKEGEHTKDKEREREKKRARWIRVKKKKTKVNVSAPTE